MSNKTRLITLGVVVFIFIVGNIIAGYYKWGASSETPDHKVLLKETAEDIGDRKIQNNEPTKELDALKNPAPVEETASGKKEADPVISDILEQIASLKAENAYLLSTQQTDDDLAARNLELKEQLQVALKTKQTLEKENEELRSAEKKNREIVGRRSELQEQIVSYKNEMSALENEITVLRDELGDKQKLLDQNHRLAEQVQLCSNASERLQKEMSEMQSSIGQYGELAARNEQLADQALECSNAGKNFEKTISTLENRIDQYRNVDAENQQLKAKLDASTREVEALKVRLDKIRMLVGVEEKSGQ